MCRWMKLLAIMAVGMQCLAEGIFVVYSILKHWILSAVSL